MSILKHPALGTLLVCNFDTGFKPPEMVKRRPVVVISPPIARRPGLCTVIALSTSDPDPVMPYHTQLEFDPLLPSPWNKPKMWVKGDMIYAVALHRLDFIREGRDERGKRTYRSVGLDADQMRHVRTCVLRGLGLIALTKHL